MAPGRTAASAAVLAFAGLVALAAAPPAAAHPFGQRPVLQLAVDGARVEGSWIVAEDEIDVLREHLGLGPVTAEGMASAPRFRRYVLDRIRVASAAAPCDGDVRAVARAPGGYAVGLSYACARPIEALTLEVTILHDVSRDYVTLYRVRGGGKDLQGSFTAALTVVELDLRTAVTSPRAPSSPAEPPDTLERILSMLQGASGSLSFAVALALAFVLGALHGLTPGHGKTITAAYMLGAGGSARQALGLGGIVAATHALGVVALGAITVGLGRVQPSPRIGASLELVAGVLIVALGFSLLRRGPGHAHGAGGHAHAPGEHAHAPRAGRRLALIGLVGGLVPGPEAVLIALVAFTQGRWTAGIALVMAFSLGIAAVVLGVAVAAVRSAPLLRRVAGGRAVAIAHRAAAAVFLLVGVAVVARASTAL